MKAVACAVPSIQKIGGVAVPEREVLKSLGTRRTSTISQRVSSALLTWQPRKDQDEAEDDFDWDSL